jgi:hypothetical protein
MAEVDIPLEIIIQVIGHSYYLNPAKGRDPDYVTLSACSLVARAWTGTSQRLLFRHIRLANATSFTNLFQLIPDNAHILALCSHVRILELVVGQSAHPVLKDFIKWCPGLYDLALSIQGYLPFELNSQHSLQPYLSEPNNVRCLRIMSCSVRSPVMFHLLALFPMVQFLHVHMEIAADPPTDPIPELKLYELVLRRALPAPLLAWLLSASRGSLRILELWDPPDPEMKAVLESYLPQLHSLGLMHLNRTSGHIPAQCTNLKELIVFRLPMPQTVSLDKILPSSLEHFGVVNDPYCDASKAAWEPMLRALEGLPNLRFFTCDKDTVKNVESNRMKEICRDRGIELRTFPSMLWPVSVAVAKLWAEILTISSIKTRWLGKGSQDAALSPTSF